MVSSSDESDDNRLRIASDGSDAEEGGGKRRRIASDSSSASSRGSGNFILKQLIQIKT